MPGDDNWWVDPDLPFAYLTTSGRRSGRPHTVEIWFAMAGDTVYLLSGGGDRSDWVRNLRAEPHVTIRVGGDERRASARLVEASEEDERLRGLLAAKYQGWRAGQPLSGWARSALPVALDLEQR
jgi:deazaflavin-dependent oxidoreductase (nitroreductase family)